MAVCSKCSTFIPQVQDGVCPKCKHNEKFTSKMESSNHFNDKEQVVERQDNRRTPRSTDTRISQKKATKARHSKIILAVVIVAIIALAVSLGAFAYFHFFSNEEPNEIYVESTIEAESKLEPESELELELELEPEPETMIDLDDYIGLWVTASSTDDMMKLEIHNILTDEIHFDIWTSQTRFIPFTATLVEDTAIISSSGGENIQGSLTFVGEMIVVNIIESDNEYLLVGTMSFIPATDEAWEDEGAGPYNCEIEEKVAEIHELVLEIRNNPHLNLDQLGNTGRWHNHLGELVRVDHFSHGDTELYFFHNGRLIFMQFIAWTGEEDRFYYDDDILIRWVDGSGIIHDNIDRDRGFLPMWHFILDIAHDYLHAWQNLLNEANQFDASGVPPFRVMWDWGNPASQIGFFEVLENAIGYARSNNRQGVRVYDANGNMIYDPNWCDCQICISYRELSPP